MQRKTIIIVGGLGALLLVLLFVVVRRSASATVPDAETVALSGIGGVVGGGSPGTSFTPAPATQPTTPAPPASGPSIPKGLDPRRLRPLFPVPPASGPSIPKGLDPRRLRPLFPVPTPMPPVPETARGGLPSPADIIRPVAKLKDALPLVDENGTIIGTAKTPPPKVAVDEPKVSAPHITDPTDIDIVPAIKGKAADLLNFRAPPIKTVGGLA